MNSLYDISFGRLLEFFRILGRAGLNKETVQAVLQDPKLADPWVIQLKEVLGPLYVYNEHQLELFQPINHQLELFVSNEHQLDNARMWWGSYLVGTDILDAERQMANLKTPTNPLEAWVLCPSFNTVEQTFDNLWQRIEKVHPNHWRWNDLKSDAEHLRLLKGITFETNRLKWVLIDFGAHLGQPPDKVRSSDSAHAELLAAACQHPTWAQSMGKTINGIFVPCVNLCGYRLSAGLEWLENVPRLRNENNSVGLSFGQPHALSPHWACPVRLGSE